MIVTRGALLAGIVLTLLPGAATADKPLAALAPFETYADGFADLRGIVVDDTGTVYVADRAAGTVVRVTPHGARVVVAGGLERPVGLARDSSGRLLVAEERGARVVRLNANGTRTPLVTGITHPRWLAVRDPLHQRAPTHARHDARAAARAAARGG